MAEVNDNIISENIMTSNLQNIKEDEKSNENNKGSQNSKDFDKFKNLSLKETCLSEEENTDKSQIHIQDKNSSIKEEETPQNCIIKETPSNSSQNISLLIQQNDFPNPYWKLPTTNPKILGNFGNTYNLKKKSSELNAGDNPNNFPRNMNMYQNLNPLNSSPLFQENKEVGKIEKLIWTSDINNKLSKIAIISTLRDQSLTKLLQNFIKNEATKKEIDTIVNELLGCFSNIIKNKNGNYLFTDLYSVCDNNKRFIILQELSKSIADDCLDKYASHSIQTVISYSNSEKEYNLILCSFDYNKTLMASLDSTGSYVIQKIIGHIPERYREGFNVIFISFISFIVNKKFGVINAKKFVDWAKNEKILEKIAEFTKANFINIATNKYGKYFIQHILPMWNNTNHGNVIKEAIIENFRILFQNNISNYICDIFLKLANNQDKNNLIKSLNLNIVNRSPNYEIDRLIMLKIMKSFGANFGCFSNNNQNQNQNQFAGQNNINNNNNNQSNQNSIYPFSLNNANKNNNFK